jgi:hypothetical protein
MPKHKRTTKRKGKRKLSNYNLVQQQGWKLLKEQGFKGGFIEGNKKIIQLYTEYKKLPDDANKKQIARVVEGLFYSINTNVIEIPKEQQWYLFPDAISNVIKIAPDMDLTVKAYDKNYGGQFEFITTTNDFRKDAVEIWKYLNQHKVFRVSQYVPSFVLIRRSENNSAYYKVEFPDVPLELYPTGFEKSREQEKKNYSNKNEDLEIEQEKTKQANIQLEIEKEKNKTIELYKQLYNDGIISKDELRKKLGF